MVRIEFETGNAAFDGDDEAPEIARILRRIADKVERCERSDSIRDVNGNSVGRWAITDDAE